MGLGLLLVAAAGPVANLLLAAVSGGVLFTALLTSRHLPGALTDLAWTLLGLNLALAIFNLLPIPPLDGGRIVDGLLPRRFRTSWDAFASMGPAILFCLLAGLLFLGVFG